MSFLYDPRTKKPQIWTYPVFVILAASIVYGFFAYGEQKSRDRLKAEQSATPAPTF